MASSAAVDKELHILKIVMPTCLTIAGVSLALRLYVRGRILKHIFTDDVFMVLAFICFCGHIAIFYNTIQLMKFMTLGDKSVTLQDFLIRAKWINGTYAAGIMMVKISIAFFMARLYGPHNLWQRWCVIFLATVSGVMCIIFFFFTMLSCGIGSTSDADCPLNGAYTNISLAFSLISAITDVIYAGLSIHLVSTITLGAKTAVSAAVFLLIGSIGGVVSFLRAAVLLGWRPADQNATNMQLGRWSVLELGLTIIAGCLATLRPLLKQMSILSTFKSSTPTLGISSSKSPTAATDSRSKSISAKSKAAAIELNEMDVDEAPLFTRTGIQRQATIQMYHTDRV